MYKIICLFVFLSFSLIQANAMENQKVSPITIEFKDQSLDSALCLLERESGYRFVYQDPIVNKSVEVNQKFENKPVSQILTVLLEDSGNNYLILFKWIIIYKKMEILYSFTQNQEFVPFVLTGIVVGEEGVLTGAVVYIINKEINDISMLSEEKCSLVTDNDGSFTTSVINPDTYLVVSFIGYLPRVVYIKDAGRIKMEPDWESLNEVITVGS